MKTKEKKAYSTAEEIANSISHGIGALLAIAGTVLLIVRAATRAPAGEKGFYVTAVSIFGFSMIFLYTMSCLYHALSVTRAHTVFERLDHSAIFVLIAGTYTAYCLTTLHGVTGWVLFGIIWGLAAAGVSLYAVFGRKLRIASVIMYILMGWIIVFAARPLKEAVSQESWNFLLGGGICYTAGAVVYMLKKIPWTHPVWHLFVLAGTILHFFSVYLSIA